MAMMTGTAECSINYYVTPEKASWDAGMATCIDMDPNATLATPKNQEQNAAVFAMRQTVGGPLYIGHHEHDDEDGNRKWAWFDGSDMTYTNWHVNQPDGDAGKGQDCGEIGRWDSPLWNDVPCVWN
jgi:hypothetical protein